MGFRSIADVNAFIAARLRQIGELPEKLLIYGDDFEVLFPYARIPPGPTVLSWTGIPIEILPPR